MRDEREESEEVVIPPAAEELSRIETEDPVNDTPDFKPDWKLDYQRKTVLMMKDGVFQELRNGTKILEMEIRKRNYMFTKESPCGKYVFIDYDRQSSIWVLKGLLAVQGKLRSVKLMYFSLALNVLLFLMCFFSTLVLGRQIGALAELVVKSWQQTAQQVQQTAQQSQKNSDSQMTKEDAKALYEESKNQEQDKYDWMKIK